MYGLLQVDKDKITPPSLSSIESYMKDKKIPYNILNSILGVLVVFEFNDNEVQLSVLNNIPHIRCITLKDTKTLEGATDYVMQNLGYAKEEANQLEINRAEQVLFS
jgi:hypothetical protein